MLNRRMIVVALAAFLFCTTITNDALATPFQPGDFITYSQDSWADLSTAAGVLLADNFNSIYGGGIEVGIPGNSGFSMIFTSVSSLIDYLPSSGAPATLNADLIDPTSTSSGLFGGFTLALQFNVDFNDAGALTGSSNDLFGDLVLHSLANYPDFNGLSVRQFLAHANLRLGAGSGPFTMDDIAVLSQDLSLAFEGGTPTQFAQDHLLVAPAQVPEPATLGLLGIGLATLAARRFKRKGRSSQVR